MGSRSDSTDSPSEAESSPSMEDEQWDQELSEEEGFLPEQPMFKGLFRPHLFKALLSKAKAVTKQGLLGEQGACPEQDPADMLFSEPTVETETVPAPQLFLDMIKKQWEAPAALPNMSSLERRFFNTASDLMELLRVPEVDDPVLALASSSATLVEPEEVLKPEDRKLEQEKVPVTDLRTHQDFNKIVAAVEYTADATMSSAKYVAKSIASSVTARRFLWLKNWQADTKRRWRLASVPFKGAKLFGEALEPVLTETKGKKKVLTALSRRGDTRFSPSFRKSYFRPYWGSAFGRYQRGFKHREVSGATIITQRRGPLTKAGPAVSHGVLFGGGATTPSADTADGRHQAPIGGHLGLFADQWEKTTSDLWIRETISSGLSLEFLAPPPTVLFRCPRSRDTAKREIMDTAVQHLLNIGAVEPVPVHEQWSGYYSMLFVIQKALGGLRPILNLKGLKRYVKYRRFKMHSLRSILTNVRKGDFLTSIDLTEAYLHVPINRKHRRFLRFFYDGKHLQYRALPFGLASAPRVLRRSWRR
ncbi:uncharacterized protein LOC131188700 isoform X2 [Ahaetulla prasina]|uniref:uncharacterized protein LOC131188700 isoform X2 n=1 Tax=Ahaetulla prasina TaxID=499056 RepID=UPI002647D071|nr:uncharacterized protein LOC131188700 isoform X2 [Ahaetulla prasina]